MIAVPTMAIVASVPDIIVDERRIDNSHAEVRVPLDLMLVWLPVP